MPLNGFPTPMTPPACELIHRPQLDRGGGPLQHQDEREGMPAQQPLEMPSGLSLS